MLDFKPHRIGHACFFKDEDWTKLKSFRIPVIDLHVPLFSVSYNLFNQFQEFAMFCRLKYV